MTNRGWVGILRFALNDNAKSKTPSASSTRGLHICLSSFDVIIESCWSEVKVT
jgi:hypothetical protein